MIDSAFIQPWLLLAKPWATASLLVVSLLGFGPSAPKLSQQGIPRTQLSEQIELARLVDLCALRLRLNIQYDETSLRGNVVVRLGKGVTDDELWALTNRLLASRGYTSVQLPGEGTLSIVKLPQAARLARVEGAFDDAQAGFVKVIRELEFVSPQSAVERISPFMSGDSGIVESLGNSRTILLADLEPHIRQALAFLGQSNISSVIRIRG